MRCTKIVALKFLRYQSTTEQNALTHYCAQPYKLGLNSTIDPKGICHNSSKIYRTLIFSITILSYRSTDTNLSIIIANNFAKAKFKRGTNLISFDIVYLGCTREGRLTGSTYQIHRERWWRLLVPGTRTCTAHWPGVLPVQLTSCWGRSRIVVGSQMDPPIRLYGGWEEDRQRRWKRRQGEKRHTQSFQMSAHLFKMRLKNNYQNLVDIEETYGLQHCDQYSYPGI